MNDEKLKGIWISPEILQDKRLDLTAKVILAVYKYYTIEGDGHCCFLTKEQIADIAGTSPKTVQRTKSKLKELKLIDTDGGIRTWYTGVEKDCHQDSEQNSEQGDKMTQGGDKMTQGGDKLTQGGDKLTPQGGQNDPHNKERKKNKKRNNKESYNLSTSDISDTSDISTSKGDDDKEDLEYMERYGISKLSYLLQNNKDYLPVMEYLQKHPTKSNYNKIEAYWADNDEYLGYLHNFNNNTLRITV